MKLKPLVESHLVIALSWFVMSVAICPGQSVGNGGTLLLQDQQLAIRAVDSSEKTTLMVSAPGIPTHAVAVPNEVASVESATRAMGQKIVVLANASASVKEVLIYDAAMQMIDKFFCYRPTLAPNGRYIAFTRFFPAHGGSDQDSSNVLMLYDLSKGPEENRGVTMAPKSYLQAGQRIFPSESQENENGPIHTFMSDNFFWSPDSATVILLDEQYDPNALPISQPSMNIRLPPRPILKMVKVNFTAEKITVGQTEVKECLVQTGSSCMIRLTGVSFGDNEVSADLNGFGVKGSIHKNVKIQAYEFAPVTLTR